MPKVLRSITRLVYHSNGGFGFQELYSETPVYVRNFLVREINNIKEREKEALEGDDSSGQEISNEDIGKTMEKLQKENGAEQADEEILDEVFGEERKEKSRNRTGEVRKPSNIQNSGKSKSPDKNQLNEKDSTEDSEKQPDKSSAPDADPAKAKDLEQMIDKLKGDM